MGKTYQSSSRVDGDGSSQEAFGYRKGLLHCGDVDLVGVAAAFGTPLYVYSADQIRSRFALFDRAFVSGRHTVCYAVKANLSLAILRLLAAEGSGFDIVSGGELERVRRAAPHALSKVVFSGVGKQAWEIDAAIGANILLFNVESASEIELLAARAATLQVRVRMAMRVNPDVPVDTHPYISTGLRDHKFGVPMREARDLYRRAATHRWLDTAGVSIHIGSQIRSVEPFALAIERLGRLISELRTDGHDLRFVDLGGGLGVDYASNRTSDPGILLQSYADALGPAVSSMGLHLLLEPGRFIVAQAGGLLTRILNTKENGTRKFLVTDAGMNDLIRPSLYQAHHELLPALESSAMPMQRFDVVGPVCESGDFFARDRMLPPMRSGDLVLILDAGAYGMSLASNYNTRCRPAEVLIEAAEISLIRRRETFDDLLATEMLS